MAKLKAKVSDLIYHDTFCNLYTSCFVDVQDNCTWSNGNVSHLSCYYMNVNRLGPYSRTRYDIS